MDKPIFNRYTVSDSSFNKILNGRWITNNGYRVMVARQRYMRGPNDRDRFHILGAYEQHLSRQRAAANRRRRAYKNYLDAKYRLEWYKFAKRNNIKY